MKEARPFLLLLTALAAAGCRAKDAGTLHLNGRLEAPLVDLAPKVPGRVVEVRVREGDRVKAGDVLVRLDLGETAVAVERDREGLKSAEARYQDLSEGSRRPEILAAEADVADKRAQLELAKRELDRQQTLLSNKIGTQRDLDMARTNVDRAAAALQASEERSKLAVEGFRKFQTKQAKHDMGRAKSVLAQSETLAREAEIRAPADGVVLHRIAEPGLLLAGGQPALTMAFADRLYVRTYVPEPQLGRVRSGMAASVRVDAFPGRAFPAKVTEISPDAEFTPKPVETRGERVNLVYAAKVDLDRGWSEPLVPGQPADVTIRVDGTPAP
jgi:HlyD family secretion protein